MDEPSQLADRGHQLVEALRESIQGIDAHMLVELHQIIEDLVRLARALKGADQEISNAARKIQMGQRLSRREFYLLRAEKILTFTDTDARDSYDRMDLLFYEDDNVHGYIDILAPVPQKEVSLKEKKSEKVRIPLMEHLAPEKVQIPFLRQEQKKYFMETHLELYRRFRA